MFLLSAYISQRFLRNPWLWLDESGQFWISKGLNHYSPPFALPQGILSVIENNRYYNLDPGGFSIILHYWTMISNHYVFIRLLPFLFFSLFLYYVFKIIKHYTHDNIFAVAATFTLFLWDFSVSRMVEIRAYSMEMLGVVLSLYFLTKNNYSVKRLLLLSIVLSIFCTSRYEFVIYAFVVTIVVFLKIRQRGYNYWYYVIFGFPLFMTVCCIYFFMMIYQNPSAQPRNYLFYLSNFKYDSFNRLFLVYCFNCIIVSYHFFIKKRLTTLELISFLVPTTIAILSIINRFPWDKVRCISVSIILFLNISVFFCQYFKTCQYVKAFFVIIFTLCITNHYSYIYWGGSEWNLYNEYKSFINRNPTFSSMFIDHRLNPSLRYLYEFGEFKTYTGDYYPHKFYLQQGSRFNGDTKECDRKLNDKKPIDLNCDYYFIYSEQNATPIYTNVDSYKLIYMKLE